MHLVTDYHDADVAVHGGKFHADEMLALQFFEKAAEKDIAVVRINDIPDDFHGVCIDIGDKSGRSDLLIYDHHASDIEKQKDGRAACGKVFDAYRDKILPKMFGKCDLELAEKIFRKDILNSVQLQDNLGNPKIKDITYKSRKGYPVEYTTIPLSFSSAIHKFNPNYQDVKMVDEQFMIAYNSSKQIIEGYCETLSMKLQKGLIADTPDATNFNSKDFKCNEQYLDKANYTSYSDTVFYNLKMAQRGISSYCNSDRIFTVSDIFTINKTKEADDFLSKTMEGFVRFEKGFHESTDFIKHEIDKLEQRGDGILVLDKYVPWNNAVLQANRNKDITASIDLVVFPSQRENRWNVQTVLDRGDNGSYRINFPPEMQHVDENNPNPNMESLYFASSYLAVFKTKEAALSFAETLVNESRTHNIPEGTIKVENENISPIYRRSMRNISFPETVNEIAPKAFQYWPNIKEVDIPANVRLGTSAFAQCAHLQSVKIQPGIKVMGAYAFANCPALTKIDLPDTICYLNPTVFTNSNNIKDVNITMTSMSNILNVVKLGNSFPDAKVTIDCRDMGHKQFSFDELKHMLIQANSRIVGAEKDNLSTQIAEGKKELKTSKHNNKTEMSNDVSI